MVFASAFLNYACQNSSSGECLIKIVLTVFMYGNEVIYFNLIRKLSQQCNTLTSLLF